MDYMEQSTLHLKVPHDIHISAKVMAAKSRISMNQYVINLIEADMGKKKVAKEIIREGIAIAREIAPSKLQDPVNLDPTMEPHEALDKAVEPLWRDKKKGKLWLEPSLQLK